LDARGRYFFIGVLVLSLVPEPVVLAGLATQVSVPFLTLSQALGGQTDDTGFCRLTDEQRTSANVGLDHLRSE